MDLLKRRCGDAFGFSVIDDADAVDGSVGEDDLDGDIALLAECRGLVGSCDKLSCRAARLCDGV